MTEDKFDIAIMDVDSIIYQVAYTTESPELCKKNFDDKLKEIMTNTGSSDGMVFIKGSNNFRYKVDPKYKGNRKDNIEPEVKDRINKLYEYAKGFCIESLNGEADDYCGIYARKALDNGQPYIVCHIDKDLNGISGWHYNFRKGSLYYINDSEAYRFLMSQALTGDATDNIKGLKGIGPKTAEKLIKDVPNIHLWGKVISIWQDKEPQTWYNNFVSCLNCVYIREFETDLRPLSLEELKERLTWTTTTDTGSLSQNDQATHLDSSMPSSGQQEDNTSEESNS